MSDAARRFDAMVRYRPAPRGSKPYNAKDRSIIGQALDGLRARIAAKQITEAARSTATGSSLRDMLGTAPSTAPLPELAPVAEPGGSAIDLGGAPDLAAYVTPFDEAEKRTKETHAAALPTIAAAYDRLRAELGAGQGEFATVQSRLTAENAARQAQAQQQMAALQAPALADLTAQAGSPVASLTGALGAEAAQQQANTVAQGQRQNSLAAEFAAQQARSHQSRVADTGVAQQASLANAQVNLNDILGQIGVQRAAAQRQYAGDTQDYNARRASLARSGDPLDAELKRLRLIEAMNELNDPLTALERDVKERQLRAALTPPGSSPKWQAKAPSLARRSPTAFAYLQALTDVNGTEQDALAGLQADLAHWSEDKRGGGRHVIYQGKRIDPAVIRTWVKQFYAAAD